MFLIDADALIEAKNRYYAFDVAPGLWDWLDAAHDRGTACSIDAVRSELLEGADELAEWARARKDFFRPMDEVTTRQFGPLTSWDQADCLLVAYGKAHGHTVVTHELSEPHRRNKVKSPDACIGRGVACRLET